MEFYTHLFKYSSRAQKNPHDHVAKRSQEIPFSLHPTENFKESVSQAEVKYLVVFHIKFIFYNETNNWITK